MEFSKKLRALRKQGRMSQEKLAEKLGVSRQAVTKWETGSGIPDIENMMAIAVLFNVSIDELLSVEKTDRNQEDFLYESVNEYDIDRKKNYDMKLGGANQILLRGYAGEKVRVRLVSNTIANIQKSFKVKIDDVKNRIDIDVKHFGDMTNAIAKESLGVFVELPDQYTGRIEIAGNTQSMHIENLDVENIEFDGKVTEVVLENVARHIEFNCSQDMNIVCRSLNGLIDLNQISAVSRIKIPEGTEFMAVTRGIANKISFEVDGKKAEGFSTDGASNIIELNGMKSELVICAESQEEVQ